MSQVKVVLLPGHVTVENHDRQQALLLEHASPDTHLLLDLSQLEMLNTLAIGIILALRKHLQSQNGKLSLICPDPRIRGVLRHTRIDVLIEVSRTREEAMLNVASTTAAT